MATAKKTKAAPKKATAPKAKVTKPKKESPLKIVKACEDSLKKLRALETEQGLQNDIQWCLGSYAYDKNPSGLYEMGARALKIFKDIKTINPKSIPATLITGLEKALG